MGARMGARTTGMVLTLGAVAVTVGLGGWTVASWPGTGVVPTQQALDTVVLAAATLAAGRVATVLALATAVLVRAGGVHPPRPEQLSWSVQVACALLVTLSGTTAAVAAPPVATVSTAPQVSSVDGVAAPRATVSTVPQLSSVDGVAVTPSAVAGPALPVEDAGSHRVEAGPSPDVPGPVVPHPGWTPTPLPPRAVPDQDVTLVTTVPREVLPDHVVVRRGDTLWDLCARHLGPQATSADIAQEWPRWYAANAEVIGPDPDLILPGQELVVPERGPGR
ncbi:LysM peptidoglycan-binding domain-containing protein [Ornithinimicrobium flavum]|uniref:LysM peptidoglycan-binding domain-containing protein n=1 Tax=Ornithinimicrobium flavum TaxID=1288636 RepID=UPI001930E745|nr:LysM domain-containing protein [Ornithinimicrobium flavum]